MRVHKKKHGAERLEACGNIVIKDLKAEGNHRDKWIAELGAIMS